jgi:hypothetical protein
MPANGNSERKTKSRSANLIPKMGIAVSRYGTVHSTQVLVFSKIRVTFFEN